MYYTYMHVYITVMEFCHFVYMQFLSWLYCVIIFPIFVMFLVPTTVSLMVDLDVKFALPKNQEIYIILVWLARPPTCLTGLLLEHTSHVYSVS
jgi:hypothetical protein